MTLLERYIFKMAFFACLATLAVLAAVVWLSQAVREFDLVTTKGQTLIVFLTVTGLSFPALITIIAPVALFIAVLYTLNRLNGDSELIVMSAAGMGPGRLMRPFVLLALMVGALVAWLTIWLMPQSFMALRDVLTKIRADVVSNIAREGQFTSLDRGLVFHFREKSGPALLGIFIQDRRDPERTVVYIAERGQTVETDGMSYLILENGSVQRENLGSKNPQIVAFQRYAFDLSQFGPSDAGGPANYSKPRERTTWQLLGTREEDLPPGVARGRFRAELHDRFTAPLYAIAFGAIAFAALGRARTTRQGRGVAMGLAVAGVVALRIAGFAMSSLLARTAHAVPLAYALPLLASCLCGFMGFGGWSIFATTPKRRRAPAIAEASA
jgi:lipopolysaccharide export system permease protein